MDNFFDLQQFLIAILRKWKIVISIIIIIGLFGTAIRFFPLIKEYVSKDKIDQSKEESIEQKMDEFPYSYIAKEVIYVPTNINSNGYNENLSIVNAYVALYNSKDVLETMKRDFFEEAEKVYSKSIPKLREYNYITASTAEKVYDTVSFYSTISVQPINENSIVVSAITNDEKLSKNMVKEMVTLVTDKVVEMCGEFECKIVETATFATLPTAEGGLAPKSFTNSSQDNMIEISLKTVVIESIKGGIWGGIAGVLIALLVAFFLYSSGKHIMRVDVLENLTNINSFCTEKKKYKGISRIIRRIISKLENNVIVLNDIRTCLEQIFEYSQENFESIIIIGDATEKLFKDTRNEMISFFSERSVKIKVIAAPNILLSCDEIKELKRTDKVLFIGELEYSNAVKIKRMIDNIKTFDKEVLGEIIFI